MNEQRLKEIEEYLGAFVDVVPEVDNVFLNEALHETLAEVRRLRAALQECLARATWDETCQCSDCKIYREVQTFLDEEPPCPSETKP